MKKAILGLWLITLTACGNDETSESHLSDSAQYVRRYMRWQERIKNAEKEAQTKRDARLKKGDTLAISPQKLKNYLPKQILGFQPEAQLIDNPSNLSGKAYSSVEQAYSKNQQHLRITISDYNAQSSPLNATMLATWREAVFQDNRREYSAGVLIQKNIKAWEYLHKRKKRGEMTLLVSDRINVSIIADNLTDTQLLRKVAEKLDLQNLSKK
ncbi:MAG: hypothetical protein MUE85_16325 [Microscillaceae bacterium]|jgi:hypothetical protein|nr:hypothetical protein [Microscillaceae bacterium]